MKKRRRRWRGWGAAWQQSQGRPPCDTMRYERLLSLLLCHTRARRHARVHVPFPTPSFHLYQPPPPLPRPSSSSATTPSLLSPPYPGSERREAAQRGRTAGCVFSAPAAAVPRCRRGGRGRAPGSARPCFIPFSFSSFRRRSDIFIRSALPSLVQFYRAPSTRRRGRAGKSSPSDSSERASKPVRDRLWNLTSPN